MSGAGAGTSGAGNRQPVTRRLRRISWSSWMEYLSGCIPWLRRETDCTVCREKMRRREKVVKRWCCGDRFHQRCIQAWREHPTSNAKLCPGCYGPIDPPPPRPPNPWPWPPL